MDLDNKVMKMKPSGMAAEEWAVRLELAALYRAFDWLGWTELIYNHITAKVPGGEQHYLINPYGLWYNEVTASNLVKVNLQGKAVDGSKYPVNVAGFVIHSAVHEARDDAQCVIHTHTPAGIAVSAVEEGLLPLSQTAMRFHGHVAYHDYEGPAFNRGEKGRLVKHLGDKNAMILRNHGLLVAAPSIPQAFNLIYWLEQACRIQVQILSTQRPLHKAAKKVVALTAEALSGMEITLDNEASTNPNLRRGAQKAGSGYGMLEWPALLRALDRQDTSYRN